MYDDDVMSGSLDITVLMGGPSAEREVSLMSGSAVADALASRGHRVTRADITPGGTAALDRADTDLFFIALHGDFGESGQVQELCEQRGLRYTGSPPRASRLGMDKASAKQLFLRAGLETPDWMILERFHKPADVARWLVEIDPPVVVKPVSGGSSLDVFLCPDACSRDDAIDDLLDRYGRVMVERYIQGRELTVGILGDEPLPLLEILPAGTFYDYHAKYADAAGTQYRFDLGLDNTLAERIRRDALTAHRSLGCRDLSRVDFLLEESGTPQVLEINTIPGFTSHSLVPMAAKQIGLDFPALCQRIVELAMTRSLCAS